MTDRELLQMALDALITAELDGNCEYGATDALRAALAQPEPDDGYCQACDGNNCTAKDGCVARDNPIAQPEPEPVAWWHDRGDVVDLNVSGHGKPLYFAPPQREWQGLTDEEIGCIIEASEITLKNYCSEDKQTEYAKAIEAKLREKNG